MAEVTARDFIGGDGDFRGLRVLEEIDEVGILVAPDAVNPGRVPAPSPPMLPDFAAITMALHPMPISLTFVS